MRQRSRMAVRNECIPEAELFTWSRNAKSFTENNGTVANEAGLKP